MDSATRTWLATWTLAGIVLLAGCGGSAEAEDGSDDARGAGGTDGTARVINVEVIPLGLRSFTDVIQLTGTVQANQDVTVSAEESGVIRSIFVEKGTRVEAGQPIARIDDRVLRAQLEQARARATLARETWERRKRLWENDSVGSEIAYLEARYAAEEAGANLDALQERLDRTVIRAPISGVLDSREVEVGTMVSSGTPVARILELDPVKITGGVPERYAADVRTGARATVTFDVLRDEEFEGEISYVGAAVNSRNRTFPVELRLPNPGRVIKPEMVANIDIVREVRLEAVVIPREALVRVEDGQVAFVVAQEEDRTVARRRAVEVGRAQGNQVVVESGLEAGDRLIVVGQHQVAEGDRVRIVGTRQDAPGGAEAELLEQQPEPGAAPDSAGDSDRGEGSEDE